ncbi:MAG: hypothetical protein J2P17_25620, partial [Mycobacterium sp.]|nr:hypothetical protein [Mycobacterium sp.]
VPAGVLRCDPLPGAPPSAVHARGLRLAGLPFDAWVDRDGVPGVSGLPPAVRVESAGVLSGQFRANGPDGLHRVSQ